MKKLTWSYSALTAYEQCPLKYYHTRIAKDIPDPPGEAAQWGTRVHKFLEDRVTENKPLPDELNHLNPMMDKILSAPRDNIYAEKQYCFTDDFKLTSWFGKDAWFRSVVDLEIRKGDKAILLDHKTGKRKPDNEQLELFAATVMTADQSVNRVSTGFLWLKEGKLDRETYNRDDVPGIWQNFVPRVERISKSLETNKWQARPSGLCRAYCPVGKARCVHCGKP